MLPDLGRLIRPLYATVAATVVLSVVPWRWRARLAAIGGAAALLLVAGRRLRRRRPVAPDGWPPAGRASLALETGDGVWRVELASGRAFPAGRTGQPMPGTGREPDRGRASAPPTNRGPEVRRGATAARARADRAAWRAPTAPASAAAADLPRRGDRVLALLSDGRGGHYVATGPWPTALAMRAYLAGPSRRLGVLAGRLLEARWGRLYHLDASGTRRLIAGGLPPAYSIARTPANAALAGSPPRTEVDQHRTGPEPAIVADAAAP